MGWPCGILAVSASRFPHVEPAYATETQSQTESSGGKKIFSVRGRDGMGGSALAGRARASSRARDISIRFHESRTRRLAQSASAAAARPRHSGLNLKAAGNPCGPRPRSLSARCHVILRGMGTKVLRERCQFATTSVEIVSFYPNLHTQARRGKTCP